MGSGPFGPFRLASVRTLISTRAAQRDTRCGPVLVSSQPLETGVSRTGAEGLGCGAHVSVAGPGLEGTLQSLSCLLDASELLPGAPPARGATSQGCRAARWVERSAPSCSLRRSQGDRDLLIQCWIKDPIQGDLHNFLSAGSLATSNLF